MTQQMTPQQVNQALARMAALRQEQEELAALFRGVPQPEAPAGVPQNWYEWWSSLWSPYKYQLTPAYLSVTLTCAASTSNACTGQIQIPEPMYVFELGSRGEQTNDGTFPAFQYLIGFTSSTENWTGGVAATSTICAAMATGDVSDTICTPVKWDWPRELNANDVVQVAVDNPNLAQQIRVFVTLRGYYVRQRNQLLEPQVSPTGMR